MDDIFEIDSYGVKGIESIKTVVLELCEASMYFMVTPEPNDSYELCVKSCDSYVLDRIITQFDLWENAKPK